MSLKYIDKNGASHDVAGISPGGNIEYGAVATRKGSVTFESIDTPTNDGYVWQQVTFPNPMPDDDYEVTWHFNTSGDSVTFSVVNVTNKTQEGFRIWIRNSSVDRVIGPHTLYWKAFKLYDVADAEALYSTVQDIEAMVPDSASSTNKFATANDLRTETRSLDRRLDDVEDAIPSSASITNKLATAEDVAEAMANAGLPVCSEVPSSPKDKDVMLYIGEETGFTKGGIYQYVADPGAWVLISTADVDLSKYETSWTGTKAEWDALPADEKKQYKIANITDDVIGGEVADEVTDGLMIPVTSNAVFDKLAELIKIGPGTGNNANYIQIGDILICYGYVTPTIDCTNSVSTDLSKLYHGVNTTTIPAFAKAFAERPKISIIPMVEAGNDGWLTGVTANANGIIRVKVTSGTYDSNKHWNFDYIAIGRAAT